MILGMVIALVGRTRLPVDQKLDLADAVLDPIKLMPIALERFCLMVRLANPSAVEFSACIGVGG